MNFYKAPKGQKLRPLHQAWWGRCCKVLRGVLRFDPPKLRVLKSDRELTLIVKLYNNYEKFFLIWFFLIWAIFLLVFYQKGFEGNFWESFSNWDGNHFIDIAKNGYSQNFQFSFFPIFPLFLKTVNLFLGNYIFSAIFINSVSIYLGIKFLAKLVVQEFDIETASRIILLILVFPASFYFLTVYSESLFFLFTVLAFYSLKKENFFTSAVFAILASLTRLAGIAVVCSLIADYFFGKKEKHKWIVLFSPLGLIFYSFFLFYKYGNPFLYITAEAYWQRFLAVPGVSLWQTMIGLTDVSNKVSVGDYFDLFFAILAMGLSIRSIKVLKPKYSVFAFISAVIPFATTSLSSYTRFVLPVFPVFLMMALAKNRFFTTIYKLIGIIFLPFFIYLFLNGYWVF